MTEAALEILGLRVTAGGRAILDDVALSAAQGEYVCVVGPNGAGKSTLLKCLIRVCRPEAGTVRIFGKSLHAHAPKELARVIAYVPQGDRVRSSFSVRDFVMMGRYPYLKAFRPPGRHDTEAVDRALADTGMLPFADRSMRTLSGGESQKVFVAAALAQEPRILLLDEPTTFLDPAYQAEIARLLARITAEREVTTVTVTHDINAAALASDRIIALVAGRVVFAGPAREFMDNAVLSRVYGRPFLFAAHPATGVPLVVPEAPPCAR